MYIIITKYIKFILDLEISELYLKLDFGSALEYLIQKHQELESIYIQLNGFREAEDDYYCMDSDYEYDSYDNGYMNEENEFLRAALSHTSLYSITLEGMSSDGCFIGSHPINLLNLEKLNLLSCQYLSHSGLEDILKRCGSKLRELSLSGSSFIRNNDHSMSERRLYNILTLYGSNLRKLNLSNTKISEFMFGRTGLGIGFEEGVQSLPNLEILRLDGPEHLVNIIILEMLRIWGSNKS